MSRPNYTKLAVELYRLRPDITDREVQLCVCLITGHRAMKKTVDYWKTQARKAGVPVPDRRCKNG